MTGFLASLLLDPKSLAVILSAFGAAIGWLIRNDRSCKRDKAVLTEKLKHMKVDVDRLQGSVDTLCTLLKRETHIG